MTRFAETHATHIPPWRGAVLVAIAWAAIAAPIDVSAQNSRAAATPAPTPSVLPLEANGVPLELASLGGIVLTKNGAVIFGDTKPVTVRVREGRDGAIRQLARAGAGPGEFRSAPDFVGFTADSIAAYDPGLERWSVLAPSGTFARVLATGPEAGAYTTSAVWVVDGALVFNASLAKGRAPLTAVLNGIIADAPRDGAAIVIRQTRSGDLWSAPTIMSRSWTVYDRAGRKRAVYNFPTPFRFASANDTVAIGQTVDDDGLPQIMRMPLRYGTVTSRAANANGSASGTVDATDAERAAGRTRLTLLLRTIVQRQEGAYADSGHYVMNTRTLKLDLPAGVRVDMLDATNRGWFAIARDSKAHVTCAMGVGMNMAIGWSEAIPYCSL